MPFCVPPRPNEVESANRYGSCQSAAAPPRRQPGRVGHRPLGETRARRSPPLISEETANHTELQIRVEFAGQVRYEVRGQAGRQSVIMHAAVVIHARARAGVWDRRARACARVLQGWLRGRLRGGRDEACGGCDFVSLISNAGTSLRICCDVRRVPCLGFRQAPEVHSCPKRDFTCFNMYYYCMIVCDARINSPYHALHT